MIISTLPCKMREKWRVSAFDIQEVSGRRTRFSDLLRFINRQAKIATDPVFGDIKDVKDNGNVKMTRAFRPKGSTFATSASPTANAKSPEKGKNSSHNTVDAYQKPCVYYEKQHTLVECYKIRNKPHNERIEFLKGKVL